MNRDQVLKELIFKAVRSGGAGGQHVNKVATKVFLIFDMASSEALSTDEKTQLKERLAKRLNKNEELVVWEDSSRSQSRNRAAASKKLLDILEEGLKRPKKRKKTKASARSREKRLKDKKLQSAKKSARKRPDEY